ncbi:MAG: endonuclease/exonuclease/phosphatase family protein [Cyclobacteriaceae bacterium]|nr:endonuclease/exonuclease/phosphatase family protein [Cyclobacteriaceae bacterium]
MHLYQPNISIGEMLFSIGVLFFAVLTSLQMIRKDQWWIRMSDFPHFQLTVLTFVCLAGLVFFGRLSDWFNIAVSLIGLATLVYQIVIIFPYTPLASKRVKDWSPGCNATLLSILETNVYMENSDFHKLLTVIGNCDPDIVIALETDKKWEKALQPIEKHYDYTIKYPMDNTYGLLIYSKLELKDSKINFLVEKDIPSVDTNVVLNTGNTIRLYVVHPQPPSPTENERSTERDAELVIIGKKSRDCRGPVIVA